MTASSVSLTTVLNAPSYTGTHVLLLDGLHVIGPIFARIETLFTMSLFFAPGSFIEGWNLEVYDLEYLG